MSERPTQNELDEANSSHAQDADWQECLRISEEKDVNEAICNFQEDATEDNCLCMIREIVSKLRAKDAEHAFAMRAKDAVELRSLRQQQKERSEIQKQQAEEIASLKAQLAELRS